MDAIDILFTVISAVFIVGAYVVKKKALYILCQTMCNVVLIVNYIYLSQASTAISVGIATVRFIVFFILVEKFDDIHWAAIILFTSAVGICGFITADAPLDYMFVVSVMIYSVCYKIRDFMKMKLVLFIPLTMMLVYAIATRAYSGIISHGFELSLILLHTVVYTIRKIKSKKQAKNLQKVQEPKAL